MPRLRCGTSLINRLPVLLAVVTDSEKVCTSKSSLACQRYWTALVELDDEPSYFGVSLANPNLKQFSPARSRSTADLWVLVELLATRLNKALARTATAIVDWPLFSRISYLRL